MSRKNITDTFATKTTRNDRFAQMSRQEQVIEQKKREIQARLLQQKDKSSSNSSSSSKTPSETKKTTKPVWKGNLGTSPIQNANNKSLSPFNMFSNDGSFLDQFKQLKDTKKSFDSKITISSLVKDKNREERNYSDERSKTSRWSKTRNQQNSYDDTPPKKTSRFSDIPPDHHLDQIPFTQNYSTEIYTTNFTVQPPVVVQTTILNPCSNISSFPTVTTPLLLPPPMTISVPPPHVGALIAPPPPNIVNTSLTGINIPPPVISGQSQINIPPPCIQTVELTSIPAPNPIPVHTIPQPEPINTLTIPPPAPLQLQNIPSPSPIRLNEIPNPKPIDLLNIPAPGEEKKMNKSITDPDFIKNVPPPNKSVPPPNLGTVTVTELPNISIPPPNTQSLTNCLTAVMSSTSIPPPLHHLQNNTQILGLITTNVPVTNNNIPSLMSQPILPPGIAHLPQIQPNVSICQSIITVPPPTPLVGPPPVLSQPPPLAQTNQIPPMTFPPPMQLPNITGPPGIDLNAGSASHDAMVSLGQMVAQCGSGIEDIVQQRSSQDPGLWFLFNKQSAAYQQYRQIVERFRNEICVKNEEYQPEDIYEPENATDDENDHIKHIKQEEDIKPYNLTNYSLKDYDSLAMDRKRKRKSRWGDKTQDNPLSSLSLHPALVGAPPLLKSRPRAGLLTKVTRTDPGLIQYAINTYGSTNISEEDWKKAEDHYKINLLYQDMLRKREEVERLQRLGKNKYEYDSDEETDGGTWEHKLRMQEMEATQIWANELTRQAEGKHHIGDFLPPEELKKFMEKYSASKEGRAPNLSDYKEFKLKEDNIGFKMLQKLGWQEGQGLGSEGTGIVEPINKGSLRDQNQGLGLENQECLENADDEYDAYRKRMMLAYRFRPNPLNNPRRPYY